MYIQCTQLTRRLHVNFLKFIVNPFEQKHSEMDRCFKATSLPEITDESTTWPFLPESDDESTMQSSSGTDDDDSEDDSEMELSP